MSFKRNILEERTVEELQELAKDEDLYGYSSMERNELIDLISGSHSEEVRVVK